MGINGMRMLVTRARLPGDDLLDGALSRLGFITEYLECVGYSLVDGVRTELDREREKSSRGHYDWLVLSSARTVRFLTELGFLNQVKRNDAPWYRIAAVGRATQLSVEKTGATADLVPSGGSEISAQGLLEVFPDGSGRIFLPQSVRARATLAEGLEGKGWTVRSCGIYEPYNIGVKETPEYGRLMAGYYDSLLVTSSSAVPALEFRELPEDLRVCTLGKQTQAELTRRGIRNHILAGVLS